MDERGSIVADPDATSVADALPLVARVLTLQFTPEGSRTLDDLVRAAGQPLDEVLTKALGLYKVMLDARREGKAVGIAGRPEALDTEFVGLEAPGRR